MLTTSTTILSTTKRQAVEEFRHWVHDEPVILLVILGEGPEVETMVERADKVAAQLAKNFPGLPHVVWARNPAQLREDLAGLDGPATLKAKLATCRAFALNLTDKLVDVIPASEPTDLVRLFQALNKALERAAT